jgi:hypothetical protein
MLLNLSFLKKQANQPSFSLKIEPGGQPNVKKAKPTQTPPPNQAKRS